jgi:hypothetical protein
MRISKLVLFLKFKNVLFWSLRAMFEHFAVVYRYFPLAELSR